MMLADRKINELEERIAELETELEWYHTLKIVRQDDDITRIDGGETAQLLHEMWEENIRLKAEVLKRGISKEEVEDIFGGKMMNAAQQGAELLSRGKQIDILLKRVEKAESEYLEQAKRADEQMERCMKAERRLAFLNSPTPEEEGGCEHNRCYWETAQTSHGDDYDSCVLCEREELKTQLRQAREILGESTRGWKETCQAWEDGCKKAEAERDELRLNFSALYAEACPDWAMDGVPKSMIDNAKRYRETAKAELSVAMDGCRAFIEVLEAEKISPTVPIPSTIEKMWVEAEEKAKAALDD